MSGERLCGPDCPTPDLPHIEPQPDWIGDWPVMHGEDDNRTVPGSGGPASWQLPDAYCLCGHPNYLTCPETFGEGSIFGVVVERRESE